MSVLLPRAITYSAAVIDHFFRGRLNLNEKGPGRFEIQNLSTESLHGRFEVFYDSASGQRQQVWVKESKKRIPPQGAISARFSLPNDATRPGEFLVVFTGEMGTEGRSDGRPENLVPFAVAATKGQVPSAPGVYAGVDHQILVDSPTFPEVNDPHTHSGAKAFDWNANLNSYTWSWLECPGECPTLSGNVSGSLSGGDEVSVPGPTFTPNAGGSFVLRLMVTDADGNETTGSVVHTTTSSSICALNFDGSSVRVPEPTVSVGQHHFPKPGTHEHVISVRSNHDAPYLHMFNSSVGCCDENYFNCVECEPLLITNYDDYAYSLFQVVRVDPGEATPINLKVMFPGVGNYYLNYKHLCQGGKFWAIRETVEPEE